jgi:D-galactarolactone cycloisomerase
MKITKLEPIVLCQTLEKGQRFAYSQKWYDRRMVMILKVETDEGIVGWGEAFGPAFVNKALIETVYAPLVIGRDPFDSAVIWDDLYNWLQDHGQKGAVIEALSAIDLALWDIKGKAVGMPCYKLLGGAQRDRLKPYATGLYHRESNRLIEELAEEARSRVDAGFLGVKLKIGFGMAEDRKKIAAIRRAIGDDIALMVDANHCYNAATAIRMGRVMEDCGVEWFEEPVPPEDIDGYLAVKSALKVPIAGGEAEFTKYGFYNLIDRRAVDILQMDNCVMGGLTEYFRIVPQAQVKNIQCCPHIWGSSIAVMAGIHAAIAQPDFPKSICPEDVWLELDQTPHIFRDKLSAAMPLMKDGYIDKPTLPGLGLEIDEDLIAHYRVDGV